MIRENAGKVLDELTNMELIIIIYSKYVPRVESFKISFERENLFLIDRIVIIFVYLSQPRI